MKFLIFKVQSYVTIIMPVRSNMNIICIKVQLIITEDYIRLCRETTCFGSIAVPALPKKALLDYSVLISLYPPVSFSLASFYQEFSPTIPNCYSCGHCNPIDNFATGTDLD